ncbi:hypothetical protein GMOD_00005443 [Pyrenophora seminiperda CCB06]|uniref:Uncharacterized protein n=1 Tax=Pyrenophora seminiperda CCB06 TaxID=1302712 RepID=A0A3M7LVX5_9PLEO|nr:hypothetical protein GMOD_00005443 [Pyrenophora seminiperda CCB06]
MAGLKLRELMPRLENTGGNKTSGTA